ncbi:MAG: WecB/TagA/CpsF family glycosyltransferase [Rhodobacteraceae bacterium]|nr:WecB/TagA/CpsF family glycosyltransferase [Paracoccaceae bacterium]
MKFRLGSHWQDINVPDRATLVAAVSARLLTGQGFSLATLNLDHLVKLSHNPDFRQAYGRADLVVADGNPVVWLSRLARRPVELQPGSDLVLPLARIARDCGASVALVGSTQGALEKAAARLQREVPGLSVTACIAPSFGFDPEGAAADAVLNEIEWSGARLCFLALGAPKQEVFAARARGVLPGVGFASVGAGLDFLAETQKRAPLWVRRLAMEWAWRMAGNPRRLARRYLQCALILPGQTLSALRLRVTA